MKSIALCLAVVSTMLLATCCAAATPVPLIVYAAPELENCVPCERLFCEIGYGDTDIAVAWQHGNAPEWVHSYPTIYSPLMNQYLNGFRSRDDIHRWLSTTPPGARPTAGVVPSLPQRSAVAPIVQVVHTSQSVSSGPLMPIQVEERYGLFGRKRRYVTKWVTSAPATMSYAASPSSGGNCSRCR